jgi:hypothetical protein
VAVVTTGPTTGGAAGEPLGTAAEEAVRLVEALRTWAQDASAEHLATGAPECRVCPLCRLVAALRDADPETTGKVVESVVGTVTTAVALVEPAVRSVVEAAVAAAHAASEAAHAAEGSGSAEASRDDRRERRPGVQHIDVEHDDQEQA